MLTASPPHAFHQDATATNMIRQSENNSNQTLNNRLSFWRQLTEDWLILTVWRALPQKEGRDQLMSICLESQVTSRAECANTRSTHHLTILKWKLVELFYEATGVGVRGCGMDTYCLLIWCGLWRYGLCFSQKLQFFYPSQPPEHRVWWRTLACSGRKKADWRTPLNTGMLRFL